MTNEPKTGQPMCPMTTKHPQWDDFLDRLYGSEGCNFHLKIPNDMGSLTWTCDGSNTCPISRRILESMGLTPDEIEASLSYFREHSGWCDCEVLLNVGQC
jgi:hypothetical protein